MLSTCGTHTATPPWFVGRTSERCKPATQRQSIYSQYYFTFSPFKSLLQYCNVAALGSAPSLRCPHTGPRTLLKRCAVRGSTVPRRAGPRAVARFALVHVTSPSCVSLFVGQIPSSAIGWVKGFSLPQVTGLIFTPLAGGGLPFTPPVTWRGTKGSPGWPQTVLTVPAVLQPTEAPGVSLQPGLRHSSHFQKRVAVKLDNTRSNPCCASCWLCDPGEVTQHL